MADFFSSQVEFINHDAKWAILQSMMSALTFHRFFMILGSDAEDYGYYISDPFCIFFLKTSLAEYFLYSLNSKHLDLQCCLND